MVDIVDRPDATLDTPDTDPDSRNDSTTSIPDFAHPSEKEFAQILDFYGLKWDYEPRSFPLKWDGDRVTQMFTPDFYLRDLDMYVELTTLKQSLVTVKNGKIRLIRKLYPGINIKLLYRRDYHQILAKYGFGPLANADTVGVDQVLFTTEEIRRRVAELGREITHDYQDKHPVLIGVLRGMLCFMADLMREISLPVEVEMMAVSSYHGEEREGIKVTKDLDSDIEGRHVILVEDIVDSGMTLYYLLRYLWSKRPASIEVCTLLDKRVRRIVEVPIKYRGFEVPDKFVVGYGLDYEEKYRNLPFIGTVKQELNGDKSSSPK